MASVLRIITPREITVDWPLSQGESHKLSAGPPAQKMRPLYAFVMKHLTLIKFRTAVPAWLLYNISVYKNRLWEIKNWDQFLERLVSPCRSLSHSGWVSIWSAEPPCLLIMPGLLRSDWGGLSVSSPSGERKDACGLRKWCKLLVLKFYCSLA